MLEQCKTKKERWGRVDQIVNGWLEERSQLLIKYCGLSKTLAEVFEKQSEGKKAKQGAKELDDFCQILMDYMCAGHFEVFDQLLDEAEAFADGGLEFAAGLYPKIEQTTTIAVAFNDNYDGCGGARVRSAELQADLSALGESLSSRFDLEDKLLDHLHFKHKTVA